MREEASKKKYPQVMTDRMNTEEQEFLEFQAILLNKSRERSEERRIEIELLAKKFKIEDYLNTIDIIEGSVDSLISVGTFLEDYIKTFNLRQNRVAEYFNINPTTLNKVIRGGKMSYDLALKWGMTFKVDPMLLIDIQDKNKLIELKEKTMIEKYSIDDLLTSKKNIYD